MKIKNLLLIIILSSILCSCLVEQKIVLKYQDQIHHTPILFQNSAEVYLVNSKGEFPYNVSTEILNYNYDSSFQKSDLVQHINVYDFKDNFGKYLLKELQSNDLNIYTADSIVPFINQESPRMIVDVIQIEVEEFYDNFYESSTDMPSAFNATNRYLHLADAYVDDDELDFYRCHVEIPRNAIVVSLWLQIDLWFYDSTHINNIVFMDYVFADDIEGKFIMKDFKNPQYLFTVDSLNTHDLWKVSEIPNEYFAENIIDFLVNKIVENRNYNLKEEYPRYNYKYKKSSGLIIPYKEELPYIILYEEK